MARRLVPRELLDPVIEYFQPQRVILFGSTARGEAGPDSDIDLLVIVDIAAFHCQQAAEKLLKGFHVLAGKRFGKTHSLAQLGQAAQASFPDVAELVATVQGWSGWVAEFRYPTSDGAAEMQPDEAELHRALGAIDQLAGLLRSKRPDPPAV
jgi:HEPN domain/Nucleotidyltransferase domain